jgi:Fanconi anemia group M protein
MRALFKGNQSMADKDHPSEKIHIIADYREHNSGIIELLKESENINLELMELSYGDYVVEDIITVERKTAQDFVCGIMSQRLFNQCSYLKDFARRPLLLIERNPYKTSHKMTQEAIRGAIVYLTSFCQIPILLSFSKKHTVDLLTIMGNQAKQNREKFPFADQKPKKLKARRKYILQGFPGIGPKRAQALLKHFGSIENIACARLEELIEVEGISYKTAEKIRKIVGKDDAWEVKESMAQYWPCNGFFEKGTVTFSVNICKC